jgi:hypothetical protein
MTTIIPDLQPVIYHPSFFQTDTHFKKLQLRDMDDYIHYRNDLVDGENRKDQDMTYLETYETPYKGILGGVQELTNFSKVYFSKENIAWLQENIRYTVYKTSNKKYVIGKQDETNLLIVMKAVYLQNSKNPSNTSMYKSELYRLDKIVVDTVVPDIITQLQQHDAYIRDISKIPVPIALPKNTSIIGTKLDNNRGPADVWGIDTI